MSYGTSKMLQTDTRQPATGAQHAMNVSLKQHADVPHILRQSNYLGSGDMRTANVNFRVMPHADAPAPPAPAEPVLRGHELYPTQSTAKQVLSAGEHDWTRHEIVASVAGLHTKLAELDSEIRSGASADVGGASIMRQMQDHASLIRDNGKLVSETQSKQKEVTGLMHKICSQMHDTAQQQSTTLEACQDDLGKLKQKHTNSVGLVHNICTELQKGLLERADDNKAMQMSLLEQKDAIKLLQNKDVVAQALLGKMLTMLDQHDAVVSNGKPLSHDHLQLLECMCEAFEKTKQKMQTFEQTQQDMLKVVADFKAARLPAAGAHESEALQTKLDRYLRLYKDIDGQCSQALQQHSAKMDEMQLTHQLALHEQRVKIQQLELAQQQAVHEQQSKIQSLERKFEGKVQELALQHLNHSQKDSINRVTERDVKLLKHEMQQMHGLKKDFDRFKTDNNARSDHQLTMHKDLQQVKSRVNGLECRLTA